MSDEIVVSGGGVTAVAVDELFGHAQSLEAVSVEAAASTRVLAGIDEFAVPHSVTAVDVAGPVIAADASIEQAIAALAELDRGAAGVALALRVAAEGYGLAERASEAAARQAAASLGQAAGFFVPTLALFAVPVVAAAALPVLLVAASKPGGVGALRLAAGQWFEQHRSMLMQPIVVDVVRTTVSSVDDFTAGLVRLPPALTHILGDNGLGITGAATSAAVLGAVGGRFGILGETPVRVTQTASTTDRSAPESLVDRVDRVPQTDQTVGGAQIVIDRIESPGREDRFEVYIAGTVDFTPVPDVEAFDMTSNIAGVGELPAGSYRAVREAMAQAGVTSTSPVVFTGHSQGGLIASSLAASGDYATAGVFTFGAPSGGVETPDGVPVIAIEHSDDLVPALAGTRTDHNAVLVERRAYEQGEWMPDSPLAPHEREAYRTTAQLADRAADERLADAVRAIARNTEGATRVTTTSYLAERVGS